jgi:putative flippase GtrA
MTAAHAAADRRADGNAAGTQRVVPFVAVGLLGFVVQIAALHALVSLARWPWFPATLLAVELAILNNFLWHERFTWSDRTVAPEMSASRERLGRLARFHVANGAVSIAGSTMLMAWLVGVLALAPVLANTVAVIATSVVNFLAADRWVFRPRRAWRIGTTCLSIACCVGVASACAAPVQAAGLGPLDQPETVAAWEQYVVATEQKLQAWSATGRPRPAGEAIDAAGESMQVPGGTISDWGGAVFIPHITLDDLLHRLQHPGTPPPQEDVVSSHVIARGKDSLRVGIRLVRRAIVTVSYDTEHDMQFKRLRPTLATARSVATRIEQVDGGDHGFLWRLHSYWRYEEIDGGVLVELRSLTLSRNVPLVARPIAGPLVNRVARESMVRTLEALRRYLSQPTAPHDRTS